MTEATLARGRAIVQRERICAHEGRHIAASVLSAGVIPRKAEVWPTGGRVENDWERYQLDAELAARLVPATLAGLLDEGQAPGWPVLPSLGTDERALAALVDVAGYNREQYERAVVDTWFLMATPEFSQLEHLFAYALEHWGVLTFKDIEGLLRYIDQEEEPT
jgi:hypothetical protein